LGTKETQNIPTLFINFQRHNFLYLISDTHINSYIKSEHEANAQPYHNTHQTYSIITE